MGIASWVVSGIAAFLVARIVPISRQTHWKTELVTAVLGALIAGLAATALDFGGWRELDWRAATFSFFAALSLAGAARAVIIWRDPSK
jgi:uncharacterized membrane protein YeaQ/YmgE (transglycosylase-associated protein family)